MRNIIKFGSFLIVTTIIGTIAACDKSETKKVNIIQNTQKTENKETKQGDKLVKVPKLLWWQIGPMPQDNEAVLKELNKYSNEKVSIEIDIKYADWGEWEQKFPTIVLSGENFDLMFSDYTYYTAPIHLNAFADITDIINNDVPKLKEFIPDILWDGVKVADRIYSVPTYKDSSRTQYWVWDKALVDRLGINYKNIKSYAELEPALRKIKEDNPQEYPLSSDKQGIQGLLDEFDSIEGFPVIGVAYDDKDSKVINVLEQESVLEKLQFTHKWYNEGLINPNVQNIAALPNYKMVYAQQGFEGADTIWSITDGYDVVSNEMWGPFYSTTTIRGSVNVVSSTSKYIKEAVEYLELVNTDSTMRNMLAYGIEGKNYKKTKDNTIEYLDENYKPTLFSQATFFTLMPVFPNPSNLWDVVKSKNQTATISNILGFSFDHTNVKDEFANCKAEFEKYKSGLLTGVREPVEALKEINNILYGAGLQKIIDEAQLQIDSFLAK